MTTITIDRATVEQALEALEKYRKMMFVEAGCRFGEGDAAITNLRAALAQQDQQAPESTYHPCTFILIKGLKKLKAWDVLAEWDKAREIVDKRLRAAPPQQVKLDDPERRRGGPGCDMTCCQPLAQQAEPLNLRDPAVQKRLATQWGYVPAAQAEPVEPVATLIARRNDILRMAHEASLCDANGEDDDSVNIVRQLERFLALAIAAKDAEHQQALALQQRSYEREIQLEVEAEREACAKVCENIEEWQGEGSLELDPYYSDTYAAAIRARNNT